MPSQTGKAKQKRVREREEKSERKKGKKTQALARSFALRVS